MRLIITRPRVDAVVLAEKLEALGHEILFAPVLEIVARDNVEIPNRPWAALLLTSANGVRCLPKSRLDGDLRVITVGPQSAAAAREHGFHNVEAHGGDVQGLAKWICSAMVPNVGSLLYLTGHEISGDLAGLLRDKSYDVSRIETYQAIPTEILLTENESEMTDGVLLYSPRSARLWVDATSHRHHSGNLVYYCLSQAVADVLPASWKKFVAQQPNEEAMIGLLERPRKGE